MLQRYKNFLYDFDNILNFLFQSQEKYIKCKKGCSQCCEKGNYPVSQLEFAFITQGYINLPPEKKKIVQKNIEKQKQQKQNTTTFEHSCPFLINKECSIYEYRGIICRTFGLCYYDDNNKYVRLPDCVYSGLNYAEYFDREENILKIQDVPKINLRVDRVLNSELSALYDLDPGEIRPILDWLK